MITKKWTRPI